jgi:hypothetical protein
MTTQPSHAGRPWRDLFHRASGLVGLLLACGVVAAAAAFTLDRYRVAKRRQAFAASLPVLDASALPPLRPQFWLPRRMAPGTPAPPFRLADVRTGQRVSLDESRSRRPVILLLGSFG